METPESVSLNLVQNDQMFSFENVKGTIISAFNEATSLFLDSMAAIFAEPPGFR